MTENQKLLDGIKIIELSHIMAAPTCGQLLADMGAEVVKVERLPKGDDTRRFGRSEDGDSAAFAMMNRNKSGLGLNLKTEKGKSTLRTLIDKSDVFIENYRMGAMEHYGVGWENVRESNPRLIYCSISGFGRTGPYSDRGGFDLITQAMSGIMSITGEGPGRPPVKVGAPITDITAGILAALGICGAIIQRHRTGKGQYVDTSLYEAGIFHTFWQTAIFGDTGEVSQAMGSAHPLAAPYQAFKTSDSWLVVGAANQSTWLKFVEAIGSNELANDDRFSEPASRMENLDTLVEILNTLLSKRTTSEWMELLDSHGVPAGPVYDIEEMVNDPHTKARNMVTNISSATGKNFSVMGHPVKYSSASTAITQSAPLIGQDSREILTRFNFTSDEIDSLVSEGVISDKRINVEAAE
ncbi:MAG: CoA transferase [Alphaproteobacteria bacterium]|jgi:crotonobetainyl-CoA:carnitine CoA-transferase CaiB-like acyl-CoA transferase|nr:CoA transferase [Alphaproteobacteria bacterium]PPR13837.1 MAG: Acetyl-CoA:oxalate CoA-transferase [Alphaproteobacteria bacterium MarineAlpha12_Bin1]|tara:strand:- start:15091 stop:16320 length:1230 start_codon:yes stop_codon:yes gene_type:complete